MAAPAVLIGGDGPTTMSIGYIVLRMTGGAIGYVRRAGPRNGFAVGCVARTACQGHAMITGIIAGCVYEGFGGRPRRGGVTGIAILGGDEVPGILACGRGAVVAGRA